MKKISKIYLLILSISSSIFVFRQNTDFKISLDSIIINKNPNYILKLDLESKDLTKKGIDFTVKYTKKNNTNYTLFNIPVKHIETILIDDKVIFLEIKLKETNDRVDILKKSLMKYLGDYNKELSREKGSEVLLYFGKDTTGFIMDAFYSTSKNMGHLSTGYVSKKYKELDEKMRNNN